MLGRQARSRRQSGGSSDEYFLRRLNAFRVHGLIAAGRAAYCLTTSILSDDVPGSPHGTHLAGFMSSSGDQNAHSVGALDRSDSPVLGFWGSDAQRRPVMVSVDGESLVVVVGEQDEA